MKIAKKLIESIASLGWIMTEDELYYDFKICSLTGQDFSFCIPKDKVSDLDTLGAEVYDYYNCFDISEATYILGHEKYEDLKWYENKIYELFLIIQKEEIHQRKLYQE